MSKKNILIITPFPLYPAKSGGRIAALSSINQLSSEYNYHLLAESSKEESLEFDNNKEALLKEYYKVFKTVTFVDRPAIPCNMPGRLSKLRHYIKHVILGLPLMDISYYSDEFINEAKRIVKERHIDILEVHHLHMAFVKKYFKDTKAILVNHNLETKLWPFWIPEGRSLGIFLSKVFRKFSKYYGNEIEMNNSLGFDALAYVSLDEMNLVNAPSDMKFWLPPSFKINKSEKTFNKSPFRLLWIGGFSWPHNVEACEWFFTKIWPKISHLNIRVDIIGENPPKSIKKMHDKKKVFVHGFVDDISEYLEKADTFMVPLKNGGGIRVKILEAMNNGIPVVSTSKGCEGLPYTYGENILVADEPEKFADFIAQLYESIELRKKLSVNARKYVHDNHSEEVIANRKREIYNYVLR